MKDTLDFFHKLALELVELEKKEPVSEYIPSTQLYETIDLALQNEPLDESIYQELIRTLVLSSPRTATKGFFNQLFGGRNEKAILGELLSVMLNNSMYTYKAAGPQIGVEKTVIRKLCDMIGWGPDSDGTLAPGGSMTNLMAMIMGRDHASESVIYNGIQRKMTVYTSKESHYSIPKNAAFSGIGRDNIRYIGTDEEGALLVDELENSIKEDIENGYLPCLVNLTAGTTVLAAFDPIRPVSEICKKHNIWLHVDGAYCGSVIFSDQYRYLIDGVELVDSFSVNAHKMLRTPLSCSLILVKDKSYLYHSFSNDASYLYQTDHDEFNLGKMSMQCGRRNDALKFWTLWKSIGTDGLEKMVDHQFALADTARNYIRNNKDYTLYSFDDTVSACFNYKNISPKKICNALYEHSELMVGYGSFDGQDFIRLVTINSQNDHEDILNFFKKLESFVERNIHELQVLEMA